MLLCFFNVELGVFLVKLTTAWLLDTNNGRINLICLFQLLTHFWQVQRNLNKCHRSGRPLKSLFCLLNMAVPSQDCVNSFSVVKLIDNDGIKDVRSASSIFFKDFETPLVLRIKF